MYRCSQLGMVLLVSWQGRLGAWGTVAWQPSGGGAKRAHCCKQLVTFKILGAAASAGEPPWEAVTTVAIAWVV